MDTFLKIPSGLPPEVPAVRLPAHPPWEWSHRETVWGYFHCNLQQIPVCHLPVVQMGSVDGDHTVVHSCFVKRIVEADCQIKYRNIRHFFQLLPVLLPVHQPEAQFLLYLLKS